MKKISILLLAGLLYSGGVFAQYEVKGDVGSGNAPVVLKVKKDFLAEATMKNGKFSLKGKVQQPTDAYLSLKGEKGGTLIFLEKARYSVQINPTDSSWNIQGGGELQKLHREYIAALKDINEKRDKCIADLKKAYEENNWQSTLFYRVDIKNIDSVRNDLENNFIREHADSPLSAYYVYAGLDDLNFKQLKVKYELLGEKPRESEWGKAVTQHFLRLQETALGSVAPDFTQNTPEGEAVSLHQVKSKIKIIDFWASWCGPCRAKNPELVELYKTYKEKGLEIIGVSLDNKKEPWEKAIKADGLPWIHVSSLKGWECPIAQEYLIRAIPCLFVLDENNRIILVKPNEKELKETIQSLLK